MNPIRFSIATPTRNALGLLQRCVGSVRGQCGVGYEHLIQDALSTDGTPEWLASQPDLFPVSEKDAGMYDAINRAWSRGRGEFCSWLNSDEQYLPGTLAKVAQYFDAHPDVDVVFGYAIVVDPEGRPIAARREVPFRRLYVANSFLNTFSCTLFFRNRLREKGLLQFDTQYRYAGDMDLMLRLDAAGAKIAQIPDYLSIFGVDGNNLSTHPRMQEETAMIQRAYGAFSLSAFRHAVLALRRVERLFCGCYREKTLEYLFATDAVPQYLKVKRRGLGGRYSLENAVGCADEMVPYMLDRMS